MAGDLPGGKWTPQLIGVWWPQASIGLRQSSQLWGTQASQQEQFAQDLRSQQGALGRNKGATADDLIERFRDGQKYHLSLAEKYAVKRDAFSAGADAIDNLREGLRGIADEYSRKIEEIERQASRHPGSRPAAAAKIAELIAEANSFAAYKSEAAVAAIGAAVQRILTAEGSGLSTQQFFASQQLDTANPRPEDPQQAAKAGLEASGLGDQGNNSTPGEASGGTPGEAASADAGSDSGLGDQGNPGAVGTGGEGAGGGTSGVGVGSGGHVPGAVSSGVPSGGSLSPAALSNGVSPDSLGQAFSSGASAGQPAAAGAQSLSAGTMNAAAESAGQSAPAQSAQPAMAPVAPVAAVSAPTVAAGAESAAQQSASAGAAPASTSAPVVSSPAAAGPAATVIAAPAAAPIAAAAAPAGPLPAYGADLRPPVTAAPIASPPPGPIGGAPVAPSAASVPSAGGSLVSPVDRSGAPAAGAAQGNANASGVGAAGVASATTGAAAGDAAKRLAEREDLQRKVDAAARQAPMLAWAAGARDDGTTTLLVTDLAGGWIPPTVKIPAGVTVLAPAARRRDLGAVDLLGAVVAAAAHQPNGYISAADSTENVGSGERARYGHEVDEFGPTLVDTVRRRDTLPRIVQTVARAATRKSGLVDAEVDILRGVTEDLAARVLSTYPDHEPAEVADWMLLAAIEAVIDEHEEIARYHLAWHLAVMAAKR